MRLIKSYIAAEPLVQFTTPHQLKLNLTPRHYIDSEVLRHGDYEFEVTEALVGRLGDRDVFWDVGANIGLHSLYIAIQMPKVRVVAFDPNTDIVSRLRDNAHLNNVAIEIVQSGLWHSHGLLRLNDPNPVNPGMTGLESNADSTTRTQVLVPVLGGDDCIAHLGVPSPTVIKIDAEGAETSVLSGLRNAIDSGSVHTVVFEQREDADEGPRETLRSFGFQIAPIASEKGASHCNYIATRESNGTDIAPSI
ncbi:Methyltransferase domain protein [Posidoniimonas polymericola]|uniref:Methyltransferase domain protein n=2 Tax=Posidoniimonas polymericola TaxID=2528002 RepID=A0A5C5YU96_9BACT|nr:Methyltransferase domain protein [Posidoniimonas polymericola]